MREFSEGRGGRKAWGWVDIRPSRWSDEASPEVTELPSCRGAPNSPTGGSPRASVGTSLGGEAEHGSQRIPSHN